MDFVHCDIEYDESLLYNVEVIFVSYAFVYYLFASEL
jgi:hypothetical protein